MAAPRIGPPAALNWVPMETSQLPRPIDLGAPRSLVEILASCRRLYRLYPATFAALAFGAVIPVNLLVYGLGFEQLTAGYHRPSGLASELVTFLTDAVVLSLVTATHVAAVSDAGAGRRPSARRAADAAFAVFAPVLVTVLIVQGASALGLQALVLPGVYLTVRLYVAPQALVAEDTSWTRALTRSWTLVGGRWWRVLGMAVVVALLTTLPADLVGIPLSSAARAANSGLLWLAAWTVIQGFVLSFAALVATLLYFDLAARHGSLDR